MTQNQIEYWKLQEEKRSNLARETETNRANLAAEAENRRYHQASEAISREGNEVRREANIINSFYNEGRLSETERHNLRQEELGFKTAENESRRIDLGYYTTDSQREIAAGNLAATYVNLSEVQRSNLAREAETSLHNRNQETLTGFANETSRLSAASQASTNAINARTRQQELFQKQYEYDTTGLYQGVRSAQRDEASAESLRTQAEKNRKESNVVYVNAVSNAVGAAGRVANSILRRGN